jgi:ABC-type antimicrobial peptide transport system permease subunit
MPFDPRNPSTWTTFGEVIFFNGIEPRDITPAILTRLQHGNLSDNGNAPHVACNIEDIDRVPIYHNH